jgi:glycosyltransferase involved in cell wall biosynthesis
MKILYFCTNSDRSGAPVHVLQLLDYFSNSNECFLVVGKRGELFGDMEKKAKKTYFIGGMQSRLNPIKDIVGFLYAIRIALDINPDVIHCHSTKAAMYARIAGIFLRKKTIYTVHGWGFGIGIKHPQSGLVYIIEKFLAPFTNFFIFVSNYDKQVGREKIGINNKIAQVIYNGAEDHLTIRKTSSKLRITMIARVSHQKDYKTLFRATNNLDVIVNCVGEGTDSSDFCAAAMKNQHTNEFIFSGSTGNIKEVLANTDIFVLSSRYEGLPISIIEAMSASLPIIAAKVGGVPELIEEGVNGYVFKPGDWESLKKKIMIYQENSSLIAKHGEKSRRIYEEKFRLGGMNMQVEKIYNSI